MKDVLVFFSGGKDSFITACKCVEEGYHVKLISFNNGCVANEENILHSAERLISKYGEEHIEYVGCYNTWGVFTSFRCKLVNTPFKEIYKSYPHLCMSQLNCMQCQSSMWVAGIAYCIAKDIKYIATGYKNTDNFCTGIIRYLQEMKILALGFGIEVLTPMFDSNLKDKSVERDIEMGKRGFLPCVYEPKCMLGCPSQKPSQEGVDSLMKAFKDTVTDTVMNEIQSLVPIFKNIKLSPKSIT